LKRAVFLDRDNTLIKDDGYIHEPEKVKLLPTVGEGLKLLKSAGLLLIVVSNQSGIGRGYFSEKEFHAVNRKLNRILKSDFEIEIDDFFFCPHRPDEKCICRKPSPFLILKAAKKWKIDIKESFMIGDKEIDVNAGKNAGCKNSFSVKEKTLMKIAQEILKKT